jgi:hypothetical protein
MAFEVRPTRDLDEFSAALFAIGQYFAMVPTEDSMQRFVDQIGLERMLTTRSSSRSRAGRVEEMRDGALSRADALFRWDRHPWCPEIF